MKTVEIKIKVEVPDDCRWVAVHAEGDISAFVGRPHIIPGTDGSGGGWVYIVPECPTCGVLKAGTWKWGKGVTVANWRETLTEVPDEM